MKCDEVKRQTTGYLEDLVTEPVRAQMRGHLTDCSACRQYLLSFGSFAGDLQYLASLNPPFDFTAEFFPTYKKNRRSRANVFLMASVAAGIALLLLVFALWKYSVSLKTIKEKEKNPQEAAKVFEKLQAALPALQNRGASPGARAHEPSRAKRPIALDLQPFHWRLNFATTAGRESFAQSIQGLGKVDFQMAGLTVLTLTRDGLASLLGEISQAPLETRAALPNLERLPSFSGTVRTSLLMKSAQSDPLAPDLLYWQLHFILPGQLSLSDALHQAGFHFLYEAPELWVVEVSAEEFPGFKEKIRFFRSVNVDMGGEADFNKQAGQKPVCVVLYIVAG